METPTKTPTDIGLLYPVAEGSMPAKRRKPTTIDEYLRAVSEDRRKALQDLRKKIRSILPDADECISYGIPAFRLHGEVVAGFCATAKGCSYLPFSGSTLETLAKRVADYEQTKSSLHFSPAKPLPLVLVRGLIRARMAENGTASGRRRRER
jgi:uncharacterized protein YdhG (YjbR/CyaY superfamily)